MAPKPNPNPPRSHGPADVDVDATVWRKWGELADDLARIYEWREWTAADATKLGVFDELHLSAERVEQSTLRWLVGVPVYRLMLTAGRKPGTWRIVHAARDRPSTEWDRTMFETYGPHIGWPELWTSRHLTPFGTQTSEVFIAAWSAWAQVGDCHCGRFGALHTSATHDRWQIGPAACRHQDPATSAFVESARQAFGWGQPFQTADVVKAGIDVTALQATSGDERSIGRSLGRLADGAPPGEAGWFLVRLGAGRNGAAAWPIVSWGALRKIVADPIPRSPGSKRFRRSLWHKGELAVRAPQVEVCQFACRPGSHLCRARAALSECTMDGCLRAIRVPSRT